MKFELKEVKLEEKPILRNLIEFYEYDFSEYTRRDVNCCGTFEYKYLDNYWTEENRFPFFIKVKNKYAGFALVAKVLKEKEEYFSIAEFFILKKYRRNNLGKKAAFSLFDKFKGKWHVHQYEKNLPSQIFWRKVIAEYTSNNFTELDKSQTEYDGPCQVFEN